MSIHSSLRTAGRGRKFRSVLKRYERLRVLKDKNLWSEDRPVLGIPKVKQQRIRVKKEKAATPEAASTPPASAAATPTSAKSGSAASSGGKPAGKESPKTEKK